MAIKVESSSAESGDEKDPDKKILAEVHAFIKLVEDAEHDIRRLELEDQKFLSGEQWPDDIKRIRDLDGRPCLVINKMPQVVQQITNDQRQNRPAIKAHPVDDKGDVETAKVIQGMIRHIEYDSNADVAYDTAFDGSTTSGRGYWRLVTQYVSPTSFDQEIKIKRVRNAASVYFDPYSQEPDGNDANKAAVVEDLSPDEFKSKYPDSKISSSSDFESLGNQAPDWISKDRCRVAEYFYREYTQKEIVLLSNGETKLKEELQGYIAEVTAADPLINITVVRDRKTMVPVIKWCKVTGVEVLEKTDWLGIYIPIVPVYGTERYINGKRTLEGIVRNSIDAQRAYNYWTSAETEAIALAPRAPFIAAVGQIEGFEQIWETANTKNHSYLPYNPKSVDGTVLPPPQRNAFEPAVQAITNAKMFAADDVKATSGMYDAAMGAQGNETSGVAIQRRANQAQTSNFHFVDNLTRSIKHTGKILTDLIPKVYDTARATRVIAEDGEQKIVQVNAPFKDKNGKDLLYPLDTGKYDVTMDVGPSFASKRMEAASSMLEMTKSNPAITQLAGDLIVKNMDWPGAQEISERLKKALPPGMADDPAQKDKIPPQIQAQMQQQSQLIEQLTDRLNQSQDLIQQKTIELESKERIEFAKLENQSAIELAKLQSSESLEILSHQMSEISQRLSLLNFDAPIESPLDDDQDQNFAPEPPAGAPGAEQMEGEGAPQPTGGFPPGSSMEGP